MNFYYIATSVLLENTPLVKFIRNHIRDSSGIFSSSGLPRKSSAIIGNLRQSSEIFEKCSATFVRSSGKFWRIFENLRKVVGNLRKVVSYTVISIFFIYLLTITLLTKKQIQYTTYTTYNPMLHFYTEKEKKRLITKD